MKWYNKKSVPKRQTGIKEGVISDLDGVRAGQEKPKVKVDTVMQMIPNRNYFPK